MDEDREADGKTLVSLEDERADEERRLVEREADLRAEQESRERAAESEKKASHGRPSGRR